MSVLYCTPADVREAVSGTDSGTGSAYQLTDDQLDSAILRASAKVSAYAGTVYDDSDVPDLIFTVTVQIATYYATMIYRKGVPFTTSLDPVLLDYQDAMATLTAISSGQISPDPTMPDLPPDDAGLAINTVPRVLTDEDAGVVRTFSGGGVVAAGASVHVRPETEQRT